MLKEVILLVFYPSRFIVYATELNVRKEFETNKQLRESFPDGRLPAERLKEFEEYVSKSTNRIRRSFVVGFGWVLFAIAGGWTCGSSLSCLLGPAPKIFVSFLQLAAAGILLGATLSLTGWEIQTGSGQTIPEGVNRWLYRALYIIGTWILILSLTWA